MKKIKYKIPKIGLFSIYANPAKYILGEGWKEDIKQYTIIAEDEHWYYYNKEHGIHKSRLIRFNYQLSLF